MSVFDVGKSDNQTIHKNSIFIFFENTDIKLNTHRGEKNEDKINVAQDICDNTVF